MPSSLIITSLCIPPNSLQTTSKASQFCIYLICHAHQSHLQLKISLQHFPTMAACNENAPLPILPDSDAQASILNFLFPGFTRMSTAIQRYFTIDLSVYAPLLCFFGLFMFACGRICKYLRGLFETYCSKSLPLFKYTPLSDNQ